MAQRTISSHFESKTFEKLIEIIDEVGALYDSQGISFDYNIYNNGRIYSVRFKLYG